jgi:hypothetical protein
LGHKTSVELDQWDGETVGSPFLLMTILCLFYVYFVLVPKSLYYVHTYLWFTIYDASVWLSHKLNKNLMSIFISC